jgi:Flp pilus assembly protein TadB
VVVIFVFIVLLALCFGAWTYWRQRQSGYTSWYHTHWKKVDRAQRRRIIRSIRRGEAVEDPRDASLALELIAHQQRRFGGDRVRRRGWLPRVHLVLLALLALSVGLTGSGLRVLAIALIPLCYVLALHFVVHRLEARAASAREKNEQLVGRLS